MRDRLKIKEKKKILWGVAVDEVLGLFISLFCYNYSLGKKYFWGCHLYRP